MKFSRYLMASMLFIMVFIVMITFNAGVYSVDHDVNVPDVIYLNRDTISRLNFYQQTSEHTRYAVIVGGEYPKSQTAVNTVFLASILMQPYAVYNSAEEFFREGIYFADVLLIATPSISFAELLQIKNFLATGGRVVFAVMPERELLLTREFQDMAGIVRLYENHIIEGFAIYGDLLLERTFRADEWEFDTARVFLTGRCKVFATGHDPHRDRDALVLDRRQENPLIWRTFYQGGAVYFINAPFMEYDGGIGILMGILADTHDVLLHPIIGSKAVLLEYFPYIPMEHRLIYNRTIFGFMRDIVWPNLISIALESGLVYTAFVNYGIAHNSGETISFFRDQKARSIRGELGYTLPAEQNVSLADIAYLNTIHHTQIRTLRGDFQGIYENFPHMTSLVIPSGVAEAFEEITPRAITLPTISRGLFYEQESFNFMGVAEALGLVIHSIDMSVIFCEGDYYVPWNYRGIEIGRYFSYLFRRGHHIPFSTVAWTAEKTKDFFNTSFDIRRTEHGIDGFMEGNAREISFILRTRKTIVGYQNCQIEEIEENAFLVISSGPHFSIRLE